MNKLENNQSPEKDSIEYVVTTVLEYFKTTKGELMSLSRADRVVYSKKAICLILKNFNYSYSAIARVIGRNNHTTVIYHIETIKGYMSVDISLRKKMQILAAKFDINI